MTACTLNLWESLSVRVSPERILRDEPMSLHTTFQVGGPVEAFVEAEGPDDILAVIEAAREAGRPWRVIGCGSNVLVSDEGLAGVVVYVGGAMSRVEVTDETVRVEAGATNKDVADAACEAGLTGYEFASGIPGSIGGAAIMNAGAYGGEFKDVCASVACLFPDGEMREVSADEACWGYRTSMMQEHGLVVLAATLQLEHGNRADIQAQMDDLTARRAAKQPLELGSAGSTFKRPAGHYAGQLIDEAGMRGHRCGGAMVSTKHAGFVVNVGGATAADVLQVIRDVQEAVWRSSGVRLEPEVRMWGFTEEVR